MIGAALAGALACAGAQAQEPVTERQAASYIHGGFMTDSAHAILSKDVKLGPELQRRLALAPGADSRAIYEALVALTDPAKLAVRKAGPDDLLRYAPLTGELKPPLFALEAADATFLIQYDLQANNIAFVGQLAPAPAPVAATKPAPSAAAEPPKPALALELSKAVVTPPPPRGMLSIAGVTPYKIDIQQGNNVSQAEVSQLKLGMSREQVRALLGTPLLTDIFHGNRWDYVYFREHSDGSREQRRFALHFDGDKLARLDGDVAAKREAN
jgi:outer membrane protein assembly factor BamE (lipoprotein component of BamABCDE complex)